MKEEKEKKIFQLTAKYLAEYIQALTDGKEEVFLAVTNINVKILPDEYLLPVEGCQIIRVEQEDYWNFSKR